MLVPLLTALVGIVLERTIICRIYQLDHLYGLLLTLGIFQVMQGLFVYWYGTAGLSYPTPHALSGGHNLGFMYLPNYRAWVVGASLAICFGTWYAIERTRLGAYLRAATENPTLVRAFGINVPLLVTAAFGGGVALAGLAGVLAAPIYQVNPLMGGNIIITVFAVVVIGGLGSILGSIVTGIGARPARRPLEGFLSGGIEHGHLRDDDRRSDDQAGRPFRHREIRGQADKMTLDRAASVDAAATKSSGLRANALWIALGIAVLIVAPYFVYPLFLVKFLCMALFAIAFNLLLGGGGLLSFGHAAFFGSGAYIAAEAAKVWGLPFEAAVLVGMATATLLGVFFGAIAIRRQGLYFAMITLALAQGSIFSPCAYRSPIARTEFRECRAAGCSASSICATTPRFITRSPAFSFSVICSSGASRARPSARCCARSRTTGRA